MDTDGFGILIDALTCCQAYFKGILIMTQIKKNREVPIDIPANLPFLKAVCWQTEDVTHFTLSEMDTNSDGRF